MPDLTRSRCQRPIVLPCGPIRVTVTLARWARRSVTATRSCLPTTRKPVIVIRTCFVAALDFVETVVFAGPTLSDGVSAVDGLSGIDAPGVTPALELAAAATELEPDEEPPFELEPEDGVEVVEAPDPDPVDPGGAEPAGVTAVDAAETWLVPPAFVAVTVKVYEVPSVSPATVTEPATMLVAVRPPGDAVTV